MNTAINFNFKKLLTYLIVAGIIIGFCAALAPQVSSADEGIVLTVTGNGVNNTVQFTMDELRALPQATYDYSGYNRWPSLQLFKNTTGPTLKTILDTAGLKDNVALIDVIRTGGVCNTYTREDLLDDPRYYFPAGETAGDCTDWPPPDRTEEGKVPVETMIALDLNGGKLMYGQRAPLEPICCKASELVEGLLSYSGCTLLVTTDTPEQWEAPHAIPAPGIVVSGKEVTLQHQDGTPYCANVCYTLDGSEPTIKSNIFNISYPSFQPELNKPVPINGNVVIKARTIGAGKYDSEVKTFYFSTASAAADLSSLVVDNYELVPAFEPAVTAYTVNVPDEVTSVGITAATAYAPATLKINGTPVVSGSVQTADGLVMGDNTVVVEVKAGSSVVKTYTLTVKRADNSGAKGDVNGDSSVDILDVVFIVNIVLGKITPDAAQLNAADMNSDEVINILDVVRLVNNILGV